MRVPVSFELDAAPGGFPVLGSEWCVGLDIDGQAESAGAGLLHEHLAADDDAAAL
jgi:hypothetical protein